MHSPFIEKSMARVMVIKSKTGKLFSQRMRSFPFNCCKLRSALVRDMRSVDFCTGSAITAWTDDTHPWNSSSRNLHNVYA